jgi:phage protein D
VGLNVVPQFRIMANSQDITAKIRERLKHLKLTDQTGVTSGTLEICLSNHGPRNPIQIPSTGAELEVFLGYDGSALRMGLFIVDEIELSGFPSQMTIRARATPYETSKQGRVDTQSQKTHSWNAGSLLPRPSASRATRCHGGGR